jgi:uncharacterized membrane protein
MSKVLTYLFGILLLLAGINHFVNPSLYNPFIPEYMPQRAVNYVTGLVEIVLGVSVFPSRYRRLATLGILVLMLLFLPLHAIDVFRKSPAIGSHTAALIRLPLQFVLIVWAWYIWKFSSAAVSNR